MKNPFSEETRILFIGNFRCFNCSHSNQGLELHHIFKRVSASPYNATPICRECHELGDLHSDKRRLNLIQKTTEWLVTEHNYQPSAEDREFMKKYYRPLYENSSNQN
ncbi:hypothetical protein MYX07_00285 [Patescibacteria group bacterium AH-259-L07]|nr:hypothetical protein [Patescibacteria group bacterium AH-259-L07]